MKTSVSLDTKDVRVIISKFLNIRIEDVIPNKYSYSVVGISESDIMQKLKEEDSEH